MNQAKYIGMDVHQATISVAVIDSAGKLVMECILETKASTILQFIQGLHGSLRVTFEEGTCAACVLDSYLEAGVIFTHCDRLFIRFGFVHGANTTDSRCARPACQISPRVELPDANRKGGFDERSTASDVLDSVCSLQHLRHRETHIRAGKACPQRSLDILRAQRPLALGRPRTGFCDMQER